MDEVVKNILKAHRDIFGDNPVVTKCESGFTNDVYEVNGEYILKICTDHTNEAEFINEIDYYRQNKNNIYIPKMLIGSSNKFNCPYSYEILSKLKGSPLFKTWQFLTETQRKDIVRQICDYMKYTHRNKGDKYDWSGFLKGSFNELYTKAVDKGIFTDSELSILEYAYFKFSKYTGVEDVSLVHNDLHFDNIFFNNGDVFIIDFERSMYAPIDYEFNILGKMLDKPYKFANEGDEHNINPIMLENVMDYIKEYYPEIVSNKYFEQRKAIYDLVYFLEQLVDHPENKQLHNDVMESARIVAFKDELEYEDCKTPEDLFNYIDSHIKYGWLDKDKNKHINYLVRFKDNYLSSSVDEIINSGVGTCIEQAKLAKHFLDENGYETEAFCKVNDPEHANIHCYVLYKDKENDNWHLFEHSRFMSRGIWTFDTKEEAEKFYMESAQNSTFYKIDEFPDGLSFKQFLDHVYKSEEYRPSDGRKNN